MKSLPAGIALGLLSATSALAGQQYVDESGYAASGYDVVAYRTLKQSPEGQPQPQAVPGKAAFTADYNGAKWAFASEANRSAFLADPAKFAPAYDGHCAYGVSKGGKVPGNPNLWRIVDGKLYLNITPQVVTFWEEDIPGKIVSADSNWKTLEPQAASSSQWTSLEANKATYSQPAPLKD